MIKRYYFFTLATLFFINHFLPAQSQADYYNKALEAYARKDYKEYLSNLQGLEKAGASHPFLIHMYAGAYALNELPDETMKQLARLGEMGLFYSIEEHTDFKAFIGTNQYSQFKKQYGHLDVIVNKSSKGFEIPEKDFIPEGIAYDPVDQKFFVGSLHKNKIVSIDASGKIDDFKASGEDGLFPVVGIKVDAKKRVLWACSSAEIVNPGEARQSGVFKFDLKSKKLIKRYLVSKAGEDHFLNDLVLAPSGDVYISDSHGGKVYTIPVKTDEIEVFELSKTFGYPNGITISDDGKFVFLASFHDGITRIDLRERSLHTLSSPTHISLLGIDGLYFADNSLLAVQNGIEPQRIVKFDLGKDYLNVIRMTVLEARNPLFQIPTTGVVAGDYFYFIANSHLRNLENGKIIKSEQLRNVQVLKVNIRKP